MTERQNPLLKFRDALAIDSVSFMKIWSHYDRDESGYLDSREELEALARDLLEAGGREGTSLEIDDLISGFEDIFDADGDNRLGLGELAELLAVEDNFLTRFNGRDALTTAEIEALCAHYDRDHDGALAGDELLAFVRDLLRRESREPTRAELDLYAATLLRSFDTDRNGRLDISELGELLA
ncbi:EF-hand domain-containing protein [Pseudenhygromyxa sp. WMMC2535]|uniref:EF-hand domain-containing protein n=1 Tax=Pseudenhygromyxa sp. WMMC2535 TaxID=2712867 RepID=UPI001551F2BA|nr:EF-hand domain-containing protein [Pseudenhygromyxa sp. WMMC2535]NVB38195.1 EF-hand domain-containing protein [Pseudenhygromyxa sp. WMMC2535]NVB43576.1 EF-hand domain-containing protein [Pseudenhygromyxa sp. WMMC2535]